MLHYLAAQLYPINHKAGYQNFMFYFVVQLNPYTVIPKNEEGQEVTATPEPNSQIYLWLFPTCFSTSWVSKYLWERGLNWIQFTLVNCLCSFKGISEQRSRLCEEKTVYGLSFCLTACLMSTSMSGMHILNLCSVGKSILIIVALIWLNTPVHLKM